MSGGADESLREACGQALERQARLLAGEPVSAEEQAQLAAHLAACAACRQLKTELSETDAQLRSALAAARAQPGFVARVMAALPAALPPHARPAQPDAPRVFVPARRRSWARPAAGIAAAVAAGVLLWAAATGKFSSFGPERTALKVTRGCVLSPSGQAVRELKLGEKYTVQETTVFPLAQAGVLKVQPGAEFQLQPAGGGGAPHVQLKSGDLYVRGQDDQEPVRVAASSFEAVLHKGDFFVAEETADAPAGVVIVFAGHAQVSYEQEDLPLRAGQVFLSIGRGEWMAAQTLELSDAADKLVDSPPVRENLVSLRREYEARVQGYQQELKVLERQAGEEQDAQQRAELRERYQRVLAYRDAHQRRLEALFQATPFEAIRRGLEGHTDDPAQWM